MYSMLVQVTWPSANQILWKEPYDCWLNNFPGTQGNPYCFTAYHATQADTHTFVAKIAWLQLKVSPYILHETKVAHVILNNIHY